MAKHWANTWTEVEDLGNNKFAASIHVGHKVFKDKVDGQYKKHKLTDERPIKDYVLVQSGKCCIEVSPFYVRYFDPSHENIRLHEERWVVQRLKSPDKWRDVDAYNPVITTEETDNGITVNINYTTDYGTLTIEYLQRDGCTLKHNIIFKNTSGSTETFRVVQAWAGIVGTKCNGKDIPMLEDVTYLAFHNSDKPQKEFNIAENLRSMIFNPDGSKKTNQCLQRPIQVEAHANGMKADFIYGNWTLAQDESLEIDPDTATLDDSTEDGYIYFNGGYQRNNTTTMFLMGHAGISVYRAFVEWDVSGIPEGADVTDTVFKYHGQLHDIGCHIHEMLGARPSTSSDSAVYSEAGEGTVYADPVGFPEVGTNKSVDLGTDADSDLEGLLSAGWFAIGIQADGEVTVYSRIYAEEGSGTPDPTLYVEYTLPILKLSGTSVNAISTVGAINIVLSLIGTSVNTIATSSALNLKYHIAGTSASYVDAVAGYLRVIYSYSGTSTNVISTVGGALDIFKWLSGTSVSVVNTVGALNVVLDLTGVSTSVISTLGGFGVTLPLTGISINVLSTTGALGITLPLAGTSENAISTLSDILNAILVFKGTSTNVISTIAPELIAATYRKLLGLSPNVISTVGDKLWLNVSWWSKTGKGSSSWTEIKKKNS